MVYDPGPAALLDRRWHRADCPICGGGTQHRFNPHHGKDGKFSSGPGGSGMSPEEFDAALATAATGDAAVELSRVRPTEQSQRSAIDRYAGGGYDAANGELRSAGGDLSKIPQSYHRDIIDGFDSIVADRPLTEHIVVRRGLASGRRTFGGRDPSVGMEWTDHGFTSTTAQSHPERTFTGDSGVEMRILVPKGTRAFSNSHLDPDEIVLDRGLSFRVVRDNGMDPYRGTRQIDVEVIGSRHD